MTFRFCTLMIMIIVVIMDSKKHVVCDGCLMIVVEHEGETAERIYLHLDLSYFRSRSFLAMNALTSN